VHHRQDRRAQISTTTIPDNVDVNALGIYNVKYYGAQGDGTTDDTIAIQAAINAAYTAGGGIVYLPSASYLINGGLTGGTTYPGTTPIPSVPGLEIPYHLTGITSPNNGGGSNLPNGPILLFDNVTLAGDGPDKSILLAGPDIQWQHRVAVRNFTVWCRGRLGELVGKLS
jgi:Pectate lyase superfamily protein